MCIFLILEFLQLNMDMSQCQLSVSLPSLPVASNSVIPFINFPSERHVILKSFSSHLLRCLEIPITFKLDDFYHPHYVLPSSKFL